MVGFIKKGFNFARAYAKWALAGKPLRDDKYIFELYDNFCTQCPTKKFIEHEPGRGECDECGCHVKRISSGLDHLNKLAWPTEGCPDGHWNADIDEPEDDDTTKSNEGTRT